MEKYQFSAQELNTLKGLQQAYAVYQFIEKRVVTLVLSDGFCDLFGYDDREKAYYDMDHDMYRDTHPDDIARISNAAILFATEEEPYDVFYRVKKKDGSGYRIIHAAGKHTYTDSGVRLAHVWYTDEGDYTEDIEKKENDYTGYAVNKTLYDQSKQKVSRFNYLTGLPSMTYFFELADAAKDEMERNGKKAVMLFTDLSGMKFFNSKYGFSKGDKFLQEFSKLLVSIFKSENCCHVSGDHFAVYTEEDGVEERLNELFRKCRDLNGGNSLSVRVGIYSTGLENVSAYIACDRAKFACDALRNKYDSAFNYYDEGQKELAECKQYILSNIDKALEQRWIKVYYQPIVRAVNGHVCDEEALARWIDPVKGFLSPAYFIPFLEEAGLIYKLDLYMVDMVLEKMQTQKEMGFNVVPHSINFSRSDFDACDLVEEIRRRVDDAGISRDKITIEITESAVGSDFEFMKEQVRRFQELGFPVWMDDFGSGYSSLDVLQSIRFNLLKFDLIFMKKFNDGDSGKIILSELMRMATSLGVDTICEGVETKEQVKFLQEIGCSKLQGYYYDKPVPLERILEKYEKGIQIGYENPEEAEYYEAMGRINLYDLAVVANEDGNAFSNFFNTIPMAIMEVDGSKVEYVRSNKSYREFVKRFFHVKLSELTYDFDNVQNGVGSSFMSIAKQCSITGGKSFFDEQMPDGSTVHSFVRRIVKNPINGKIALAVAVLSVTDANEGATYSTIARALAADYYNIYYVDLETEHFIEYSSPVGGEELAMERHGENFFSAARRDTMTRIYKDDRDHFLTNFTKENVIKELDEQGVYTYTYRLIDTGSPMYVNMKITRMNPDGRHIIIGISMIDFQMKQQEMIDTIQMEEVAYARIMALSGNYLSLYTIDPETGRYFEYSATTEYKSLGLNNTGEDFFEHGIFYAGKVIYGDDMPTYINSFKKEKIINDIREKGYYNIQYRLMIKGVPVPVILKIVSVKENGGEKLIAGVRMWKNRR